jgi:signal transduction histidine kinase/integral membrane sensor domain MASE1
MAPPLSTATHPEEPSPAKNLPPPLSTIRKRAGYWLLLAVSLAIFHLSHPLIWTAEGARLWYPPVGLGLVLAAWFGWRGVALAVLDCWLIRVTTAAQPLVPLAPWLDAGLLGLILAAGWWSYREFGQGLLRINDPRSATAFLLIVPGAVAACFALLRAWLGDADAFWPALIYLWLSRALGILVLTPLLLMMLTPWLARRRWIDVDSREELTWLDLGEPTTLGDVLETLGLVLGAVLLGSLLAQQHIHQQTIDWHLWGMLLLLVVWASLRQGLFGGALAAGAAAMSAWVIPGAGEASTPAFTSLQGNLLALCSTALLVGASSGWIRASEMRYRKVVGHIPVILYSGRMRPGLVAGEQPQAQILLVSSACRTIFGCEPGELLGDYRAWLERIDPADREVYLAAVAQLARSTQSVTCEYRLNPALLPATAAAPERATTSPLPHSPSGAPMYQPPNRERWVRDTLTPHYAGDGQFTGWEGVVEDITPQHALSVDLQRTSTMLHTLVANLPAGVFFVQGPTGQPILVNARARQLLGQREDPSAALRHWPRVYRLFRTDGSLYPWEDLPVTKALLHGLTTMRDDIILHRPDGRQIPLVTWAAPIDLGRQGNGATAVWVFEDLTTLQQAEAARLDSEARLRTVIETMAEGLVIQNDRGHIIQCNPAACIILGEKAADLLNRPALVVEPNQCLREDGTPLPRSEQPDYVCLNERQPVRNVVLGISRPASSGQDSFPRWILVNCMPLTTGQLGRPGFSLRIITTFADITSHRHTLRVLQASEERYRRLMESLPLVVLQLDPQQRIIYGNPLAQEILDVAGGPVDPERWQTQVAAADRPAVQQLLTQTLAGTSGRAEFTMQALDDSPRRWQALSHPLWQKDGIVGSTLVLMDMTRQKRLEEEMNRVQRLELVGRLAGGLVHDLNNLLTAILTLSALHQKKDLPDPTLNEDLQTIHLAAREASQLASQLLTFSKQRRTELYPVAVDAVVQRTLDLLRGNLPRTISVEKQLNELPLQVLADAGQLQQVVMNLCLNARDAMPEGGSLIVGVRPATAAPVALSGNCATADPQEWVCLFVADTGEGMEPALQEKIFDPFFSTKERGTGLGLAVVRQLVESFHGLIQLHSAAGQGSRFEIWLPRYCQ